MNTLQFNEFMNPSTPMKPLTDSPETVESDRQIHELVAA